MRGNKMTFPFSGEFKFNHLKAKREDDVTSSTTKNLNGDLHLNSFKKIPFASLYLSFPRKCPRQNSCTQERAEENDPPKCEAFLKYLSQENTKFIAKIFTKKRYKAI